MLIDQTEQIVDGSRAQPQEFSDAPGQPGGVPPACPGPDGREGTPTATWGLAPELFQDLHVGVDQFREPLDPDPRSLRQGPGGSPIQDLGSRLGAHRPLQPFQQRREGDSVQPCEGEEGPERRLPAPGLVVAQDHPVEAHGLRGLFLRQACLPPSSRQDLAQVRVHPDHLRRHVTMRLGRLTRCNTRGRALKKGHRADDPGRSDTG
jgi:hypothetical protein